MFIAAPFYSGTAMPARMRLGFGFFTMLLVSPLVMASGVSVPANLVDFGARLLGNFVFGAGIGFFAYLIITAFQMSAQIFSIPMGLGMNEVVDPLSDTQVPALGNILGIMVLFLLLQVDGHFYFVRVIVESFQRVETLSASSFGTLTQGLTMGLSVMFDTSMKIALPIIAITLLLDMAMGMIARVAPQFNIMIMGFNIKILAGFLIVFLALPPLLDLGHALIDGIITSARELAYYMKG